MTRLMTTKSSSPTPWLSRIVTLGTGSEIAGLLMLLAVVVLVFSLATDRFLTVPTFTSVAFQLPELGLLTLAMLIPILSGGLNLAITFTANICGLVLAWVLQANGGVEAGMFGLPAGRAGRRRGRGFHRLGDGGGDRLYRRPSDPGVAQHDDLPAGLGRVRHPWRRYLRLSAVRRDARAWLVRRYPRAAVDSDRLRGAVAPDPEPDAPGPDHLHGGVEYRGDALFRHRYEAHASCWSIPCPA